MTELYKKIFKIIRQFPKNKFHLEIIKHQRDINNFKRLIKNIQGEKQ